MSPLPPDNIINIPIECCACQNQLFQEGLRFPKSQELRTKWVEIIMSSTPDYIGKRDTLEKNGLQLCVEHFEPRMLIQKTQNGQITYALRKGGFPTIFDGIQNGTISNGKADATINNEEEEDISICYEMVPVQANAIVEVMDVENTVQQVEECSNIQDMIPSSEMEELNENKDGISSIEEFIAVLKERDAKFFEPWRLLYNETSVLFSMFDADCKYLIQSFTVNENLVVSIFYHGQPYTSDRLTDVLGQESLLDTWKKFKALIVFLHKITQEKQHFESKLKHACKLIQECIDSDGFTKTESKKLKFALNQIEISNGQNKTYTKENLQWAMNAYNVNRAGYAKIYESECMTLPHPASLELLKRQILQQEHNRRVQQQVIRPKPVPKKVFKSSNENGASVPLTQSGDLSVLNNRPQSISLNNSASLSHSTAKISIGQSVVPPNNEIVVDDDISEIKYC